ncbi:hypothetical protein KSF_065530 [Reticulibacter mediterranei]|uniref:Leucine-rich repeat domain-containing protein n=1 Tax=Reticulibacter mediterranei TaxID=2778369 RepID=A0A8J3N5L3_9CHLR|nr:hypothetical protein [Reticulibacter mediterranei]GHO96505.1 hypothetical protein KSF_065530 [Reticulibacter mediterranei]
MQSVYYKEPRSYFAGRQIWPWSRGEILVDPARSVVRLCPSEVHQVPWWFETWRALLEQPNVADLSGLSIPEIDAPRDEPMRLQEHITALIEAQNRLCNLTALFIGDCPETSQVIFQQIEADIPSLLNAYPALEHLGLRGDLVGPRLGQLSHPRLKTLILETGGLDKRILQDVLASDFPALTHLELWLGDDGGWRVSLSDLLPLFEERHFPRLRYLGLRNSTITNEIAEALINAPVLDSLHILDLSLGTLDDRGVQALLDNTALKRLKKLDIHSHYCSSPMMERLQALDLIVDSDMQEDLELGPWIAVFEY